MKIKKNSSSKTKQKIRNVKNKSVTKAKKLSAIQRKLKTQISDYVAHCKTMRVDELNAIAQRRADLITQLRDDLSLSYQYAFVYIRQLAITLRKAMLEMTKEATQAVLNWQYFNCIRLWTEFLCATCQESECLATLIHPLIQIIQGTIRLRPTMRWLPARFHLIACLNKLAAASHTLTPAIPHIIECFSLCDFNARCDRSTNQRALCLETMLHFSPSQLRNTAHMEAVQDALFETIVETLWSQRRNCVALPELYALLCEQLRHLIRTLSRKHAAFSKTLQNLLGKMRGHMQHVRESRRRLLTQPQNCVTGLLYSDLPENESLANFVKTYRLARKKELEQLRNFYSVRHNQNDGFGAENEMEREDEEEEEFDPFESEAAEQKRKRKQTKAQQMMQQNEEMEEYEDDDDDDLEDREERQTEKKKDIAKSKCIYFEEEEKNSKKSSARENRKRSKHDEEESSEEEEESQEKDSKKKKKKRTKMNGHDQNSEEESDEDNKQVVRHFLEDSDDEEERDDAEEIFEDDD